MCPAGDVGVGGREIGYMFGQFKRLTNRYEAGVFTGKALVLWRITRADGGDRIRQQLYFVRAMLETRGSGFDGRKVVVSGSGNVAIYTIEKVRPSAAGYRLLRIRRLCCR